MFILGCSVLTPTQKCGLKHVGSDCCEVQFSMIGGWGEITSWQRNFTFRASIGMVQKSNTLMSIRTNGNVVQQTHRNDKAGEFDPRLHEDMTDPDADLSSYPDVEVMVQKWNSGVDEATAVALRLGMKHGGIPNDAWERPWEYDPPNPRVHGFDEYCNRKFTGDDEDDDDPGDDDEDIWDQDDGDDPMVQQVQLDFAINNIRDTAENEGDVDNLTNIRPRHMIKTPNGKLLSKDTVICMLREAFDVDGKLVKTG